MKEFNFEIFMRQMVLITNAQSGITAVSRCHRSVGSNDMLQKKHKFPQICSDVT